VKLFCALGAAEFAGATLSGSGANVYALKLSDFPRTRYDAYVASVLTPHDDDTNPYAPRGGGGAEGDGGGGGSGSSESRSATAAGGGSGGSGGGGDDDDDDATGDADPPWKPLDSIDRHENGVPKEQQHFFHEITEDMTSGHAPYNTWCHLDIRPPDATCMESFKPDYFSLRPVHFWSPEGRWHHLGVRTPCVTHGWAHA